MKKVERFVLDGSVALCWYFADEANAYADAVAARFSQVEVVVPALWHLEVANAVVFLASPRASFITGTNLIIDGALTQRVQY